LIRRRHIPAVPVVAAVGALALLAGCSSSDTSPSTEPTYTIGILEIAQAQLLDDIVAAFSEAVEEGLGDQATVEFDIKNANGDQSLITSIVRDFASSDYDAFAVLGTPAVIAAAAQITDRPIFALAMGDPVGAGVAESLEEPGGNVTGSVDYVEPALLLDDILVIHGDVGTIGTLYDPSNQNMQVWTDALRVATADAGLELVESTIATSAEVSQSARSLVGRADVVLVGPDAMVVAGMDAVGAAMSGDDIPLYVVGGDLSIPGVLASLGPDYLELGSAAGAGAVEVLLGADPGSIPFVVPSGLEIGLNTAYAEELGVVVPAELADRVVEF